MYSIIAFIFLKTKNYACIMTSEYICINEYTDIGLKKYTATFNSGLYRKDKWDRVGQNGKPWRCAKIWVAHQDLSFSVLFWIQVTFPNTSRCYYIYAWGKYKCISKMVINCKRWSKGFLSEVLCTRKISTDTFISISYPIWNLRGPVWGRWN